MNLRFEDSETDKKITLYGINHSDIPLVSSIILVDGFYKFVVNVVHSYEPTENMLNYFGIETGPEYEHVAIVTVRNRN